MGNRRFGLIAADFACNWGCDHPERTAAVCAGVRVVEAGASGHSCTCNSSNQQATDGVGTFGYVVVAVGA